MERTANTPNGTEGLPPGNPGGLGIIRCTSCGGHVDVIGPLRTEGEYPGHCEYCARGHEQGDVAEDELVALLRPWRETRDRISKSEFEDMLQAAGIRLEQERAKEGN